MITGGAVPVTAHHWYINTYSVILWIVKKKCRQPQEKHLLNTRIELERWELPQRAGSCKVQHMISSRRSLPHWWVHTRLMLYSWSCPTQEGSAHPLVACSICRSSEGGGRGFQCNIYSDLFLSLARGPWELTGEDKQWTIGFRDEQQCRHSMGHYGM